MSFEKFTSAFQVFYEKTLRTLRNYAFVWNLFVFAEKHCICLLNFKNNFVIFLRNVAFAGKTFAFPEKLYTLY